MSLAEGVGQERETKSGLKLSIWVTSYKSASVSLLIQTPSKLLAKKPQWFILKEAGHCFILNYYYCVQSVMAAYFAIGGTVMMKKVYNTDF